MGGEDPRKTGKRSYSGSKINQSVRRAAEHSVARFARREKIAAFPVNSLFSVCSRAAKAGKFLQARQKQPHPEKMRLFFYGEESRTGKNIVLDEIAEFPYNKIAIFIGFLHTFWRREGAVKGHGAGILRTYGAK